jgi:tetratricopeptide (TPR) repeat protein
MNARSREFAERALALDSESATALATLALIERNDAWELGEPLDLSENLAKLSRALSLDPRNGSALVWRGLSFAMAGNLERALADFETCVRYEPLYSACETNTQVTLALLGRDQEALQRFLASLDRGVPKVMVANLPMLARLGREDLFKVITNGADSLAGWRRHDDLYLAFRNPGGDYGDLIAELIEFLDARGVENPNSRDNLLAPLGYQGKVWNALIAWDPTVRAYRQTSTFQRQIVNGGVLDYWHENGFPDQCRPVGDDGFSCD